MPFEIDVVSEFTYFENLSLGLANALHKCIGVKKTNLQKFDPLTHQEIKAWETDHGVSLPKELQTFYLSSDGYLFEWTYALENNQTTIGKVDINSLAKLTRVYGYETTNNPGIKVVQNKHVIRLSTESKLFLLASTPNNGKVVLVYLCPTNIPGIWFMSADRTFYFLCNSVSNYLRMAIAHLGIPNWQLRFTTPGLPQWTRNIFSLLYPDLLEDNMLENFVVNKKKDDNNYVHTPINKIDPIVFDPNNYIEPEIPLFPELPIFEPEKLEKYPRVEKVKHVKRRGVKQRRKHTSPRSLSKSTV